MSKGTYLILEPVNHVNAVLKRVHAAGYKVIVLSSFPKLLPSHYGDVSEYVYKWIQIKSWSQIDENLDLINQEVDISELKGSYTGVEGALLFDSMIRQLAGLPNNPHAVIESVINKETCRKILREKKLSHIKTFQLDKREFPAENDFPVYFKPNKGGGSLHVQKCSTNDELKLAYNVWQSTTSFHLAPFVNEYLSTQNQALAETEAKGKLVSVEGYTIHGKWHPIGINARIISVHNPAVELGFVFPVKSSIEEKIYRYIADIHQSLGINWGPTHTEIMIDGDELEFIELNLRFAGYDCFEIINQASDTDLGDLLTNLGAGISCHFETKFDAVSIARYYLPPFDRSTYNQVSIPEHPNIKLRYVTWNPQKSYSVPPSPCDFVACLVVKSHTLDESIRLINELDNAVVVDGQSIGQDKYNIKDWDNFYRG